MTCFGDNVACSRTALSVLFLLRLLLVFQPDLVDFLLQNAFEAFIASGKEQDIISLDCASTSVLREGLQVGSHTT